MKLTFGQVIFQHLLPAAALLYFGFGLLLWTFQARFVYQPNDQDFTECTEATAAKQIVMDQTRAYLFGTSSQIMVVYHGNAGSACDRTFYWDTIARPAGYSLLIVEYTGYSNDGQTPSKTALLQNVQETIAWLANREYTSVLLLGESLGTGLAAYHASLQAPDALILLTPFDSTLAVAQDHYPIYPAKVLLRETYDNVAWLSESTAPILLITAQNDEIISPKRSQRLFDSLSIREKQLVTIADADHNSLYAQPLLYQTITTFISEN